MPGYEIRYLSAEKRNAIGIGSLKCNAIVCIWRKTRARTTGSADATDRRGMRRAASATGCAGAGVMVVAVAMLVGLCFGSNSASMVRFTQHHQHAGIAAQRQRRKQQGQQNNPGCVLHANNPIPIAQAFPTRPAKYEKGRPIGT